MKNLIDVDGAAMRLAAFQAARNLTVAGDLDLCGTGVTRLPAGLTVGGKVFTFTACPKA